jgi:hypothetical protein
LRALVNTIYYKPQFTRKDGRVVLTGTPVPRASAKDRSIYFLSQRSALAYFLVQRYFDVRAEFGKDKPGSGQINVSAGTGAPGRESFEMATALLNEIRSDAAAMGAEFVIVATPGWWNEPAGENYETFIAALDAHGFLVLNVEGADGFDPDRMYIPEDGHWNTTGHAFVAQQITDLIAGHQLLGELENKGD